MPMIQQVVSRERFDSVPRKRAIYIVLYLTSFILWACHAFYYISIAPEVDELEAPASAIDGAEEAQPAPVETVDVPPEEAIILPAWIYAVRILIAIGLGLFYVPFMSVLRIMGYPWVGIIAFCGFALAPIPGLLIVAYMDTRIAKAWSIADLRYQDFVASGEA